MTTHFFNLPNQTMKEDEMLWREAAGDKDEWEGDPTPWQKLTPAPIKYIKKAKELAYGFAVIYNRNIDVVGAYDGRYLYDLYINFDRAVFENERQWDPRFIFFVATPTGAKIRAKMLQNKEKQNGILPVEL